MKYLSYNVVLCFRFYLLHHWLPTGQLKLDFTRGNKSVFEYSQVDVFVSGTASHKSSFEINRVNYSSIKTPDVIIKRAIFQKFDKYFNQNDIDDSTGKSNLLLPFNATNSTTVNNPEIFFSFLLIKFATQSTVPPVASKSSTIV